MKSILIATDFSKHSKYTIDYILELVRESKLPCHITLLNTFLVLNADEKQVISVNDELKIKSKTKLEMEIQEIKKNIKPFIHIESISQMGSLKNVIHQLLKRNKYDLVAMGKDGGKNVEAVTEMLKTEGCPILVTFLKE